MWISEADGFRSTVHHSRPFLRLHPQKLLKEEYNQTDRATHVPQGALVTTFSLSIKWPWFPAWFHWRLLSLWFPLPRMLRMLQMGPRSMSRQARHYLKCYILKFSQIHSIKLPLLTRQPHSVSHPVVFSSYAFHNLILTGISLACFYWLLFLKGWRLVPLTS